MLLDNLLNDLHSWQLLRGYHRRKKRLPACGVKVKGQKKAKDLQLTRSFILIRYKDSVIFSAVI